MKKLSLLLGLLCLAAIAPAHSLSLQTPLRPAPDASADSLARRVERLERRTSGWDKVLARLPEVSGYLQLGYEGGTNLSTFYVKRVRVLFSGVLAPKLDYRLQVELVSPRLVDAYLCYRPLESLRFQVGEFKLPFSIENTDYSPLRMEFIEYPMALCRLMGLDDVCGLASTGRDLGAMASAGFFRRRGLEALTCDIGVFNGEGLNARDRNKSKDVVARVMVRPVEGLLCAGYFYRGEYGPRCMRRVRYGGGACYDRGRGVVRGEWIGGKTSGLDSEGWYVMGGVRAVRGLMAAVRYDTFRENTADRFSERTNYTAGLSWQPVKYFRCQLDYTYEHYAAPGIQDRNVVALMLSGIF